jgi:ATP-dependent exoDNAse (exonuclease V) beta subunit
MPDLDEDERKVIVQNSFEKIKKFNDDRAKLGTDAHKIAEIIFSKSKEIRNVTHAIDMINTLLGSGEIKFESELYKDPNGTIRTETIEYFLKVRSALRAKHGEDCEFRTEIPFRVDDLDVSASYSNLTDYVCGTIDLIVVDNEGNIILYDFKSSTNEFGK